MRVRITPRSVMTPATLPAAVSTPRSASLQDASPELHHGSRHCGGCSGWIGRAIRRRKHASPPLLSRDASALRRISAAEHMSRDAEGAPKIASQRPCCQRLVVDAEIQ